MLSDELQFLNGHKLYALVGAFGAVSGDDGLALPPEQFPHATCRGCLIVRLRPIDSMVEFGERFRRD